jgi:hypothetical protein
MLAYVRDKKNLTLPESLQPWAQKLVMIDDDNLRGQFYRIQEQFATIIFQDVIRRGGMFYTPDLKPSNDEVDKRPLLQHDDRRSCWRKAASALLLILTSQNVDSLASDELYIDELVM